MKRGAAIASRAAGLGAVLILFAAGRAAAEDRYAAPGGFGPEPCKRSNPCPLATALAGAGAGSGDRVLLRDGAYKPGASLTVAAALTVEPVVARTRPLIEMPTGTVFSVANAAAVVRGIDFVGGAVATDSALVSVDRGLLERVKLLAAGTDYRAALVGNGGVIRDSVVSASGTQARGVVTGEGGGLLRGLTVFAAETAVAVDAAAGANQSTTVTNTIASGAVDIAVSQGAMGSVSATISHSNYDDLSVTGGAAVTESARQTAAPLLANPAAGDFRQLPGSPTINAGTAFGPPASGHLDLDRALRLQGPAPDIGAYEFDQLGPDTAITDRPPRRLKTKRKKVAVEIGFVSSEPASAFECSLDGGPAFACASPFQAKVGKGRHAFLVLAHDHLGNRDPSPAATTWRVKRKRKR